MIIIMAVRCEIWVIATLEEGNLRALVTSVSLDPRLFEKFENVSKTFIHWFTMTNFFKSQSFLNECRSALNLQLITSVLDLIWKPNNLLIKMLLILFQSKTVFNISEH